MDTLQLVIQLIQQLGFPIAVAVLAFWYIKYREDRNDERMEKLRNRAEGNAAASQGRDGEADRSNQQQYADHHETI